ncbi:MAG: hypothetical protein NXI24_04315 [bacterium]|nr:hypothetical protein [bacterium]
MRIVRGLAPALLSLLAIGGAGGCIESQPGRHLDLSGDDWKIHFEDSSRFRAPDYDDRGWAKIAVPSNWALFRGHYAGVAWYRKSVRVDSSLIDPANGPVALYIQTVLDSDETYWNGVPIGGMGEIDDFRSHAYGRPRVYRIPHEALQPGVNVLAVRVRGFFAGDAGIRSGEVYIDDPLAIEARIVLAEQLQLLMAFIFATMAVVFFASCVYTRSWQIRGWFAVGSWAAGWIQFWTSPLAYDWLESLDAAGWSGLSLLLTPAEPFAFVKMMDYGGHYLLGISGIAFWTAYLRMRNTPLHVIYYSFSLLMYSGCVISDDLLLWNTLFDYWFAVTAPAMLWIVLSLILRARAGESRWRWLLISFSVMSAAAAHDWFFHNGFALASYSAPLLHAGLLAHQIMVAMQLTWDFRRDSERSDAEFQRLWSLRLRNQQFLQALLGRLRGPVDEIDVISSELAHPNLGVPHGSVAGHRRATIELNRLGRDSLDHLAQIESHSEDAQHRTRPA